MLISGFKIKFLKQRRALGAVSLLALFFCFFPADSGAWQEDFNKSIQIDNVEFGKVSFVGFRLSEEALIRVNGKAVGDYHEEQLFSYGWILDAESRVVVWEMEFDEAASIERIRFGKSRLNLVVYDEYIRLPAGYYEMCYFMEQPDIYFDSSRISEFMRNLFSDKKSYDESRKMFSGIGLTLFGQSGVLDSESIESMPFNKKIILRLGPAQDNNLYKQQFRLNQDREIRIYALGEFASFSSSGNDYGWIIDASTGKVIWEMHRRVTRYAGGNDKNRSTDIIINMKKGDYEVFYQTDGSHAYDAWNATPPNDPRFWGLSLLTDDKVEDTKSIELYTSESEEEPVIQFVKIRDEENISQGFSIEKEIRLHIYAIGESNYSLSELVDFAWIIDADSRAKVWEMNIENSDWAGGHKKNRMYNGIVSFSPGNYILYFYSDDSHSYNSWNTPPPFDPGNWGITLTLADKSDKDQNIKKFNARDYTSKNIIAQQICVRDNARIRKKFVLAEPTTVRIYSIGEGDFGEMNDFGWIERADNEQIMWEMTFRTTKNAGGAEKNRVADTTIMLDQGEYYLYYVTDGSHAFGDWNEAPPADQEGWGISLYRVKR